MSFVTFDVPGAAGTFPWGMNSSGVIAGSYADGSSNYHGFVRAADGTITTFDVPEANQTQPGGINDDGVISGSYYNGSISHAFVRAADGTITTFDVPSATTTSAAGINSSGVIAVGYTDGYECNRGAVRAADGTITTFDVSGAGSGASQGTSPFNINDDGTIDGSYIDSSGVQHGFMRAPDGTITTFDPPGSTATSVAGINAGAAVVGYYADGSGSHGFLRATGGAITSFDAPGDVEGSFGYSVNSSGESTGSYNDASSNSHGFLRSAGGTFTEFDIPSAVQTTPHGMNDSGVIAGWWTDAEDVNHGFVGTPDSGGPAILPPVRMKRLPLTVDLASCTYDQQNRLLQYEIYRALGPDPDKNGITSDPWKLPYTIVLRAWGEAVDDLWNILKGEAGQPICGRRITLDASVSPEWAGDYEIMEMQTFAFQGDASAMSTGGSVGGSTRASATTVQPPSGDSGSLQLTLRTYSEDCMVEVSDEPTYATVPGADLATGGW
jgi:hypothetical protein